MSVRADLSSATDLGAFFQPVFITDDVIGKMFIQPALPRHRGNDFAFPDRERSQISGMVKDQPAGVNWFDLDKNRPFGKENPLIQCERDTPTDH
jgi:hypothetical protein